MESFSCEKEGKEVEMFGVLEDFRNETSALSRFRMDNDLFKVRSARGKFDAAMMFSSVEVGRLLRKASIPRGTFLSVIEM